MFVFKADNMRLHQLHSIPELHLQNIRMAPNPPPPKKKPKKENNTQTKWTKKTPQN